MIFIGSYCPDTYIKDLIESKSSPDFAGITLQGALLNGYEKNNEDLIIFSIPNRLSYPKSTKLIIKEEEFNLWNRTDGNKLLGFINLPIVKLFSKFFSTRRALINYLKTKDRKDDKECMFVYSLHSPMLLAAISVKSQRCKLCVMITDLPEYMSGKRNLLYRFGKYLDRIIINFCLRKANSYIILSEKMVDKLPIEGKPYLVIEGIYDGSTQESYIAEKDDKEIILYTGGISERYNVYDLMEAFCGIDNSRLELMLCGPVDDQDKLNRYLNKDKRIKYLGLLSKDEVRLLQRKASLLINPRFGKEEFTQFSFPSKTLEYLASGTPTMMCNLPSLPKEYLGKLYIIEEESVKGIQRSIQEFFRIPKETRKQKGMKAREFILTEKSSQYQTKKILDLISMS